ncbi:MAG: dNTP triphosphohydrolase [Bacteroidales bacterium]|nr:dNTP triphosphohydrolase [Candidatus Colicola caccequi]
MLEPIRLTKSSITQRDYADVRNEFDSDYSRMVLSAPVRRLQDKTQVSPNADNDFVRTRLTHSLEVASFARSMGWSVEFLLHKRRLISNKVYRRHWIPSILETVGLIHDIGNPPYGHVAEKCIMNYFKNINNLPNTSEVKKKYNQLTDLQRADFEHFDGNAHGIRILLSLGELPYNLTCPTLCSFIKYPYNAIDGCEKDGVDHTKEKFGYFYSEEELIKEIFTLLNLKENQRHPLAFLLEAADDIAYLVCDIEDGIKVGNIEINDLVNEFKNQRCEEWLNQYMQQYKEADRDIFLQKLRINMQGQMILTCVYSFIENFHDIVNGNYKKDLLEDSSMSNIVKVFKNLDIQNFKKQTEKEKKGKEAIEYLLNKYTNILCAPNLAELIESDDDVKFITQYISQNYWDKACEKGQNVPTDPYKIFLLCTDYIAGMTDTYLLRVYNDIKNHFKE